MLLIDGKEVSNSIYEEIKENINSLNINPCLAVIIVGERKDSMTYVNMKSKKCKELGIKSILIKLNKLITEWELLERIKELNQDKLINGILVQLPLPEHINKNKILESISIEKDVDGFHYGNMGKLALNTQPLFVPCTPLGVIELFRYYKIELEGKHIVMIGKSNIVGLSLIHI